MQKNEDVNRFMLIQYATFSIMTKGKERRKRRKDENKIKKIPGLTPRK